MHTDLFKILCFSCPGKSRDVVYQRICLFLWLIFAQHGLFEIQLTVYSVLSRLTGLGIYDISRCGIWLLSIFHIPYIHFQRDLRKVTSPKWYLSFFVQYIMTCLRYHDDNPSGRHKSSITKYKLLMWKGGLMTLGYKTCRVGFSIYIEIYKCLLLVILELSYGMATMEHNTWCTAYPMPRIANTLKYLLKYRYLRS